MQAAEARKERRIEQIERNRKESKLADDLPTPKRLLDVVDYEPNPQLVQTKKKAVKKTPGAKRKAEGEEGSKKSLRAIPKTKRTKIPGTPLQRFKQQTKDRKKELHIARKKIDAELKQIEKDLGVFKRSKK